MWGGGGEEGCYGGKELGRFMHADQQNRQSTTPVCPNEKSHTKRNEAVISEPLDLNNRILTTTVLSPSLATPYSLPPQSHLPPCHQFISYQYIHIFSVSVRFCDGVVPAVVSISHH